MKEFFSKELGESIPLFGVTHLLLILGFIATIILLWYVSPNIKKSKHEKWLRFFLVFLVFLFEWRVFESRMLNGSIFRLPLCAISLYTLTFAVAFKNEKVFKIVYFYTFGTFLSFLFFDTPWGLDRWDGWTFFGAHATIAWLAVYGYNVLGFKPNIKDLYASVVALAIYAFISGYATFKFGGSDELFLLSPPIPELSVLVDIHQVVYTVAFCLAALLFIYIMYLPTLLTVRQEHATYSEKSPT